MTTVNRDTLCNGAGNLPWGSVIGVEQQFRREEASINRGDVTAGPVSHS
jgi:hypothetical protein